jgi:hypothetical protein
MALPILTKHTYEIGVAGEISSQAEMVCDTADWKSQVETLLNSRDDLSENLVCKKVSVTPLKGDGVCGKKLLVADFVPRLSIEALTVDLPFRWRLEASGQAVTIKGNLKWASDGEVFLRRGVLPVKRFSMTKIVLFGMRSSFDLSTYESRIDHVNSDSFLGAAPETVLFETAQAQQRMLLNGDIIYYVELHLTWRPFGWNNIWRGTEIDQLVNMDGSPIYESASMSPLLAAPS